MRGCLAIGGQRTHVRLHDLPYAGVARVLGDLRRRGFSLSKCFAQTFQGDVNADGAAVAKEIRNRFGNSENRDLDAIDDVLLYSDSQLVAGKMSEPRGRVPKLRVPVFRSDGDPNFRRYLIGQFVKCQRRSESDDALRHQFGRFG